MYGYERLTKRLAPMSKLICEKTEMNASPTDYRSVAPVEQQRAIQIARRVPHKVGEEESCCFLSHIFLFKNESVTFPLSPYEQLYQTVKIPSYAQFELTHEARPV